MIWCVCLDETWLNLQIESVALSLKKKKKNARHYKFKMVWRMGTLNIFFQFNLARINVIKKKKKKNFRILIYWPVKFRLPLYEKAFLTLNLRKKFVNMANLVTLNQFKCLVIPFKKLQIFFCIIFSLLAFLYFLCISFAPLSSHCLPTSEQKKLFYFLNCLLSFWKSATFLLSIDSNEVERCFRSLDVNWNL